MPKIKMTQAQVDKLFISFAHDLNSKLDENSEIIFMKLFRHEPDLKTWSDFLFTTVKNRLLIELNAVASMSSTVSKKRAIRRRKNGTKKSNKIKKEEIFIDDRIGD